MPFAVFRDKYRWEEDVNDSGGALCVCTKAILCKKKKKKKNVELS
jgi:hypothetical protein